MYTWTKGKDIDIKDKKEAKFKDYYIDFYDGQYYLYYYGSNKKRMRICPLNKRQSNTFNIPNGIIGDQGPKDIILKNNGQELNLIISDNLQYTPIMARIKEMEMVPALNNNAELTTQLINTNADHTTMEPCVITYKYIDNQDGSNNIDTEFYQNIPNYTFNPSNLPLQSVYHKNNFITIKDDVTVFDDVTKKTMQQGGHFFFPNNYRLSSDLFLTRWFFGVEMEERLESTPDVAGAGPNGETEMGMPYIAYDIVLSLFSLRDGVTENIGLNDITRIVKLATISRLCYGTIGDVQPVMVRLIRGENNDINSAKSVVDNSYKRIFPRYAVLSGQYQPVDNDILETVNNNGTLITQSNPYYYSRYYYSTSLVIDDNSILKDTLPSNASVQDCIDTFLSTGSVVFTEKNPFSI